MDLDLDIFKTLIPINTLYDTNLQQLAQSVRVEQRRRGELLFDIGDHDPDSIFLLSGEIVETNAEEHQSRIRAGSEAARYALANLRPRQFRAEVTSGEATIARVNAQLLEKLLACDQVTPDVGSGMEVAEFDGSTIGDGDWMLAMLQTSAFLRLPAGNIQRLFEHMEPMEVKNGQVIVRIHEPGDYFYMIKEGSCKVSRPTGGGEALLATLGRCDSFGEEALISDTTRNATVTMTSDGTLMRVSKQDFLELLEEPLLHWVKAEEAARLVRGGALLIDVRLESEFKQTRMKGALNIPLYMLRLKAPVLERGRAYVLYCDTGQRSAAAAFILNEQGYQVSVLSGGLQAFNG
ncbi:MAG: cyclic nucleotide-binding domain-containing protein [Candidatus Sedimenticola endophacoides]